MKYYLTKTNILWTKISYKCVYTERKHADGRNSITDGQYMLYSIASLLICYAVESLEGATSTTAGINLVFILIQIDMKIGHNTI